MVGLGMFIIGAQLCNCILRRLCAMEYYLMNKDTKLMKFSIDGEGVMEQCSVIEQYTNLPIWFPDIDTWISKRSAAKYRKHVQSILDMMGGICKVSDYV